MQITFDTETDDLEQLARVVEALREQEGTTLSIPGVELEGITEEYAAAPKPPTPASLFDAPPATEQATIEPLPTTSPEPATTATVAESAVERDSAGMPWDERIHAGTKTKVKDGTWKYKPGVDAALKAQVEAELKGATPPPPPPTTPAPPPANSLTYQELLTAVMSSNGAVSAAQLGEACKAEGVATFPELCQHPDKVLPVARRVGLA